jgi:hypothetical protein
MYSKITLMNVIKAIRNEPIAIDPQWYHIAQEKALVKLTSYGESEFISYPCPVKYHIQVPEAIMNYYTQIMNATIQRSPKK